MSARRAAAKSRFSFGQGVVFGLFVIASLARPTGLLLTVLLLPSLMAGLADHRPGRAILRAVILFGLAGACWPLERLWSAGHTLENAFVLASDVSVIAIAWSAQAGGWLLAQIVPMVIDAGLEARVSQKQAELETRRAILLAEWEQ